jgi:hypothetical protein
MAAMIPKVSIFSDEARDIMHDHLDEFVITNDGNVLIHLACGWTRDVTDSTVTAVQVACLHHMIKHRLETS